MFFSTLSRAIPLGLIAAPVFAAAVCAEPVALSVELNKLEPQEKGCRAYLVATNDSATEYQTFKLDLVLFQPDGVIGRRFIYDLGPLKPSKRSVKLFDVDGLPCDRIGSFLVNDVAECTAQSGPLTDCLSGLTVKSLTNVQLTK
jgi:hypothetical protein